MKFRNQEKEIPFLVIRGLIVTVLMLALLIVLGHIGIINQGQDAPVQVVEEAMGTIQGPSVD